MFYKQFLKIIEVFNQEFIEEFDYWLATLPVNKQDNISASLVSSKFGVNFSIAKAILGFANEESILKKHYIIKCPNEDCSMIIKSIEFDEIADSLLNPIFCNNCFKDVSVGAENVFVVYRRNSKPDISEDELNIEILKRLGKKGYTKNFDTADSLAYDKFTLYEAFYNPDESAYEEMKEMLAALDYDYGKNTTAKGNSYEFLALKIATLVKGCTGTNKLNTRTNQFDCTVEFPYCTLYPGIFNILSPYYIIECKNEDKTPSNTYFHKLSDIMSTNEAQFCIVFSRKPASVEDIRISYQQYLLNRNGKTKRVIISLSDYDIDMLVNKKVNFLKYIDFKILELTTNAKNATFDMFINSNGQKLG